MVRFQDGNIKAQLGPTDMRLAIQYALTYPQRPPTPLRDAPIPERLDFYPPDTQRFPALELAYQAGRMGGLAPVVLNAADEVAVEAFLKGQIGYLDIPWVLEKVLQQTPSEPLTWDNVFQADLEARKLAQALLRVRA
jgi:1-deoxy-D-xylulose-5-phosphate reductoisomerase